MICCSGAIDTGDALLERARDGVGDDAGEPTLDDADETGEETARKGDDTGDTTLADGDDTGDEKTALATFSDRGEGGEESFSRSGDTIRSMVS